MNAFNIRAVYRLWITRRALLVLFLAVSIASPMRVSADTIAFAGSNLVLEGFYSSNGLLLRLVDGAAGAVTNVAQGVLFGTN